MEKSIQKENNGEKWRERGEPDGYVCMFNHITDIFHKLAKSVT